MYRARLSYIELDRNKIKYDNLKKIIIKIEDEKFYIHGGINFKSILRASVSQFDIFRKKFKLISSGASTIEMQLARTIFIPTNQNKYKRKFLEFFFAYWFNQVLSKDEIINIYIASVRYGPNIMGLKSALQKYFKVKSLKLPISNEIAFILTERLSNISGTIDRDRVSFLMKKLDNIDEIQIYDLYEKYIK